MKTNFKRAVYGLLAGFMIMTGTVLPANAEGPKHQIMINTLSVIAGNYGPEYEYAFSDFFGLAIRANILPGWEMKGGSSSADDDYDWIYSVTGTGAGISARFYPFGHASSGLYLGPRSDLIAFKGTYEDRAHNEEPVDTNVTIATIHGELGYKFVIADRVVIGLCVDAGYAMAEAPDASSLLALTYLFGGGLYLGMAF